MRIAFVSKFMTSFVEEDLKILETKHDCEVVLCGNMVTMRLRAHLWSIEFENVEQQTRTFFGLPLEREVKYTHLILRTPTEG